MRNRKTVADVMTTDVIAVPPTMRFKRLAELLAERRVSAVPVVGETGQVMGVVSESDLIRKEELQRRTPVQRWPRARLRAFRSKAEARTAAGLMSSPAITVRPEASLPEAAGLMAEHDVTRLIVTTRGELAGIVTRTDLLSVFRQSDHDVHAAVQRSLVENALWDDPFVVHVRVRDGVVTLTGELERRRFAEFAVQAVNAVDGVVGVVDRLTFRTDDSEEDAHTTKEGQPS
ncbi:CBS domain-containing protein [Flindersiella endophytica]